MDRIERLGRLVVDARNGHPERLEDLLRESAGIAHALSRARLGETLAAEEAAAEALRRVAGGLPRLRDPRSYLGWLRRITIRCATDAVKRRVLEVVPEFDETVAPGEGPAEAARRAERATSINRAVGSLPQRLRDPVLLHFAEGLSYREVARTLGTGLSTVARRMEKSLALLKRTLGEEP